MCKTKKLASCLLSVLFPVHMFGIKIEKNIKWKNNPSWNGSRRNYFVKPSHIPSVNSPLFHPTFHIEFERGNLDQDIRIPLI